MFLTLARSMTRRNIPGASRFTAVLRRMGLLNHPGQYTIGRAEFTVPTKLIPFDRTDVLQYSPATINASVEVVRQMDMPVLIDCGAHIGLYFFPVAAECENVQQILAIEPNDIWWEWTECNLKALNRKFILIRGAVSDYIGRGRLRNPPYDQDREALYLAADPSGDINVSRLDDLMPDYRGDLILKLDIEGGELSALKGATELIRRSGKLLVVVEAHPKVAITTGIDPTEYIRFLCSIRSFKVWASDLPSLQIDKNRPFFDQVEPAVYNLIFVSTT